MIKNYFKIAWRNLLRDRQFSFLNLIGLSTGLACALLIYLWVRDELNVDKFHKNDSQLFQVMMRNETANGIDVTPITAPVLAEALTDEMPEVEYAVSESITPVKNILAVDNKVIKASGVYADENYFNLFSYDVKQGDKNRVLSGEKSIVITENLALKLFNRTENVIGKLIGFDNKEQAIVSGVFTIPANSSKQFDFVMPFGAQFRHYPNLKDDWNNSWSDTYILLKDGVSITQFNSKIKDLLKRRTGSEHSTLFVRPYSEAYLLGNYENGVQTGGRIEYVKLFSIIAIFILVIACINFMNLATAKASKRIKEVGIKKVMGAGRATLIFQYLVESMLMSFLSLLFAIVLVSLFLTAFNELTGKHLAINFDSSLILSALGITLLTGIIAGSYPAFYLSRFNPVTVLKGKLLTSFGELWTRKGLVVFQFIVSAMLITAVLVVYRQTDLIQNKKMGYNKDNVLYFEIEGNVKEHLGTFLSEAKKIPGVHKASSMFRTFFGGLNSTSDLSWQGKNPNEIVNMEYRRVNYEMIELLGIKMKEGRAFSQELSKESPQLIFNEAAVEKMGIKDPVGKKVTLWGKDYEILGVTENFHFESLHENIKPLFFFLNPERTNTIMLKVDSKNLTHTIEDIETLYKGFSQGAPLDFNFLDNVFQAQYVAEKRVTVLSRYFAGIAIIISCLGLFGLAAFTAQKRQKEIGIRKVVGASIMNIAIMLSKDFLILVLVAVLIAFPLSWWAMNQWLENFAYRIDVGVDVFLVAGVSIILITLFTISFQAIKAAIANPVMSLRTE